MHPAKTERGRAALAARDPLLTPSDRRLLILTDGKRSLDELAALLGPDAPDTLDRLVELGFVSRLRPQPTTVSLSAPASTGTTAEPTRPRRSVAVAKIYMVDMLSLMRSAEAETMAGQLHAASTERAITQALCAALDFVADVSGPRYVGKLAGRLREVMPQDGLSELDALVARLAEDTAPQTQ